MASIRSRKISASIVVLLSSRACPSALSAAVGGRFKNEHSATPKPQFAPSILRSVKAALSTTIGGFGHETGPTAEAERVSRLPPQSQISGGQRDELAPPCMTRKEHCESSQGLSRHGSAPVATRSRQALRTPIRD